MNPHTGQRRSFRIVCAILLVSMLLDRYLVSQRAPGLSGLLGFTPMIVFLDIPVDLPFTFGLLPVLTLFVLFYTVFYFPYQSPDKTLAWEWLRRRLWRVITALSVIPVFVLSGGLLYALLQDSLPRHLRNAIESFGINADIYTPLPGYELIHFHGSMVMLLFLFPGLYICGRMIRNAAPYADGHPAAPIVAEPIVAEPIVAEPIVAEPALAEPAIIRSYIPEPVPYHPGPAKPIAGNPFPAGRVPAHAVSSETGNRQRADEALVTSQAPPERASEGKPATSYSPYVNKRFVERIR